MVVSIKTNTSALVALQQLSATSKELDVIQDRVSTGLKISGSKDGASTFAVAQKLRADRDGYDSVNQSVQRGINILEVSLEALKAVSDLVIGMKAKAVQAADPSLTAADRSMINSDYQANVLQVTTILNAAKFNNFNLLDKNPVVPATDDLSIITEPTASASLSIKIPAINVKAGSADLFGVINTPAAALAESTTLDTVAQNINNAMALLGGPLARLESHSSFVSKLQDSLSLGIGSLVDADLTSESARLKSVQIQQQLSTQSLQIANSRPQQILALFQNS